MIRYYLNLKIHFNNPFNANVFLFDKFNLSLPSYLGIALHSIDI